MRLQKFLAENGVTSRRKAEEYIKQGRVKVNNKKVQEMGYKVSSQDKVFFDNQPVVSRQREYQYLLLNKPIGYLSTVKAGREIGPTVMELLPKERRLYPVGRLDKNTSGLMIFTDDGDLALRLMHPRFAKEKEYEVEVKNSINQDFLRKMANGVMIDGQLTLPARLKKINSTKFKIIITQGRKRQIRLMCRALGNQVIKLKRLRINKITLGNLPEGRWRELSPAEIASLKK